MSRKEFLKKAGIFTLTFALSAAFLSPSLVEASEEDSTKTVTLRVANWEEYIDMGDWDEDEVVDLESGDIFGENSMIDDFEDWYYETYGIRVKVEYSTFGTNEDLYNMLNLGDVYDLVCPSEYMVMKLLAEDKLVPLSDSFFDTSDENNYYIRGVAPFVQNILANHDINGEAWSNYMACYMWGVTGFVYNPEEVSREEASTWKLMGNTDYARQVTVKDNVRDTYFSAMGAIKSDLLLSDSFLNDPDYQQKLEDEFNDVSPETIALAQDYLQGIKSNLYSFETDAGKADMITGKVVANFQWSGDAAYTLDQAEDDDLYLEFMVPLEGTNIYFDGWTMLKCGIGDDEMKQHAAEAWINFTSRADNVIRNMYYIGYTSAITGEEGDDRIFEYLNWNYGAEEDEEDTIDYDVSYLFDRDGNEGTYVVTACEDQARRQLYSLYPPQEVLDRSAVMKYFDSEASVLTNQMWINVRCYNIHWVPVYVWVLLAAAVAVIIGVVLYRKKQQKAYLG